jgi:hypothetical protein
MTRRERGLALLAMNRGKGYAETDGISTSSNYLFAKFALQSFSCLRGGWIGDAIDIDVQHIKYHIGNRIGLALARLEFTVVRDFFKFTEHKYHRHAKYERDLGVFGFPRRWKFSQVWRGAILHSLQSCP